MTDRLTRYRQADYPLPETYLSWDLFGAGLEHLGRNGKPVKRPLRPPEPDELLLRVDALGLCFSDTKLIWAGPEHPRIRGRDLEQDPTVAGHEAALTVVQVGADWRDRFEPGQRYIIQADIYINGEQKAYGYVQRGAMAQYTYAGPWVLDGDDGCYLLPLNEETGYAEAALVEPWACVEAAYHITQRTRPKPDGRMLIVFAQGLPMDLTGVYAEHEQPRYTAVLGAPEVDLTPVLAERGVVHRAPPTAEQIAALVEEETGGEGFDDVILGGRAAATLVSACDRALAQNGLLAFVSDEAPEAAAIDLGRIHYQGTRHVGTASQRAREAYASPARTDLKPGGATLIVGAAGPMGQMHVQRALELDEPPARILATDVMGDRLAYMRERLQPVAERRGIALSCLDVSTVDDVDAAMSDFTSGRGFDDIYIMAPVPALVEQASRHLASHAVCNVFAGLKPGTVATLPPTLFTEKQVRLIGSSGSSMDDMRGVLARLEAGQLATRMALAALGGIETAWEGIKGVKEGRFPGKTVLFPQIRGLDLVTPAALGSISSAAADKLAPGGVWTNAAEEALLEDLLKIE